MSKKKTLAKDGGFKELQREIDNFKFQIDDLCENELPHLGAASPDRLSVYQRTNEMDTELAYLNKRLDGLSLTEAGISTKAFESNKASERKRLVKLRKRLDQISEQLEPDEVEEDYFRTLELDDGEPVKGQHNVKKDGNHVNVSDDDTADGDEEGTEEEDKESEPGEEHILCHAEALTTYHAEQDGDLSFVKGEHIVILEQSDDGWWTAQNKMGEQGVVPSTLIKIIDEQEVSPGKKDGLVHEKLNTKRSGKELWNILREKKPLTKQASINDVLKAMKAMPSGFRIPTLGTWYQKDAYRISTWVVPKITPSRLQFYDLHWDGINKKLREHPVNVCRTFSLVSVRCIPSIGAGVEVLTRHVYVAIWDEEKIVSNIHCIRAVPLERELSWTFTPKVGKNIPSLYDGDFIIRTDLDTRKLSILFEFNYTYKRASTSQQSDISCGWASLPLFELDGTPLPNKTFELDINGGTPFEKNVPLDPMNMETSETLMQSLIRGNRQPRVLVKSTNINKTAKETYDRLPSTIITCQSHGLFIGFYRHHAAMTYCREDNILPGHVCDSLLSYFPRTLSFPYLMDALKKAWDEKVRTSLSRTQRKNFGELLKIFKQSFIESVFGLMQCANIPPFIWGNADAEKVRSLFIQNFSMHKDAVGNLLSADYQYKPLDIRKLTFTVLSKHSVNPLLLLDGECLTP